MTDTARLDWVLTHDATVEESGGTVYVSFTADGMRHVGAYQDVTPREAIDRVMRTHNEEAP